MDPSNEMRHKMTITIHWKSNSDLREGDPMDPSLVQAAIRDQLPSEVTVTDGVTTSIYGVAWHVES